MKVSFFHLRDTTNIGDRWCSPFDHIDWTPFPRFTVSVGDILAPSSDYDVGILGGGKILRNIAHSPAWRPSYNIGWGISTVRTSPLSLSHGRGKARLDLIGSRDWDGTEGLGGATWVPCASSEHTFFDAPPAPKHKVVVYGHRLKSKTLISSCPKDIPLHDNHDGDFMDALNFIASGETVVSNSYHGALWALLMGRRVLCLPFSRKFRHHRVDPAYSDESRWLRDLGMARSAPETLELSRRSTQSFLTKVVNEVDRVSTYAKKNK